MDTDRHCIVVAQYSLEEKANSTIFITHFGAAPFFPGAKSDRLADFCSDWSFWGASDKWGKIICF